MDAVVPPSSSPSHYSPLEIVSIVCAGIFIATLIITWVFIYCRGGLPKTIHSFGERRKTKAKARDIEEAEAATNAERIIGRGKIENQQLTEQQQEASSLVAQLYLMDKIVGLQVASRPERVNLEKEQHVDKVTFTCAQVTPQKELPRWKDSFELSVDPLSFTLGSGKDMAKMYRK